MKKIKCERLDRIIDVSKDALPDPVAGWICDCGNWTNEDKEWHIVWEPVVIGD